MRPGSVRTIALTLIILGVMPAALARASGHGEGELYYNPADYGGTSDGWNSIDGPYVPPFLRNLLPTSKSAGQTEPVAEPVGASAAGAAPAPAGIGEPAGVLPVVPNTSAPRILIDPAVLPGKGAAIGGAEPPPPAPALGAPEPAVGGQQGGFAEFIGSFIDQMGQKGQGSPDPGIGSGSSGQSLPPSEISASSSSGSGTSGGASRRRTTEAGATAESLDALGRTIHTIRTSQKTVEKTIGGIVSERVQNTVNAVARNLDAPSPETITPVQFSEEARQKLLLEIQSKAEERGREITTEISNKVVAPPRDRYIPGQVDPVLRSSLIEIEQLVHAETGVAVQFTPESRQVVEDVRTVEAAVRQIDEQRQNLVAREGLELYKDSDNDGVSDYDERNIYRTDPFNAYTAGSTLTDGERILLGLDALSKAPVFVPVESPKVAGEVTQALFEVTEITLVPLAGAQEAEATGSALLDEAVRPAPASQAIRLAGKALPNSFVTLYIFSTPVVVTVKTDANGAWQYTLRSELEDGQHEMYVASVNNSGKIIAKSSPVLFAKTAEALEFEPLTIQEITEVSPLDTLREHFLIAAGVLLLLFGLVALIAVGFKRDDGTPMPA